MELEQNTQSTSKPEIRFDQDEWGHFSIRHWFPDTCSVKYHKQCEDAAPWNWPEYQDRGGGACPACEKFFKAKWENAQKDLRENIDWYLSRVGVGERHFNCTIENYDGPETIRRACREIAKNMTSLVLTGPTGTGKTHLAAAIVRNLILAGKIFRIGNLNWSYGDFVTVPDLLLKLRQTFNSRKGDSESDIVDRLRTVPFLVLDDLGSEKPSEWVTTTLYTIVDARYREVMPTIVTTNLSMSQIASQLHPRIASRLSDGKVIKLTGEDHRVMRSLTVRAGS
jgi:DNA replication protein DnaC